MPADGTYDYAIIRVVPRVERGERMNVGVIVSAVDADYLEARIDADLSRLLVLDPAIDLEAVAAALATIPAVCVGGPGAGPLGDLPARGRFRWLVSPRSTVIQMSPVHTGRGDAEAALARLYGAMVGRPGTIGGRPDTVVGRPEPPA
ncbi:MAG: DUF3037 domain-containing protein [Acidobacteria bacterium]|nr:DUF3037 domain-containing protein [Acidobacteriota bacterium]